jgi:translation initiation factor IF-1
MLKENEVMISGTVKAVERGNIKVQLNASGLLVNAPLSGRMVMNKIFVTVNDRVWVKMSGYDLHRGLIVRRE